MAVVSYYFECFFGSTHQYRFDALLRQGKRYSLYELLATDLHEADRFVDGNFVTIYLAPYNYHRVHSPIACELVAARYVPGELYSVNAATVSHLSRLFAGNERLVCHFDSADSSMILVFVGAMNVGSISTNWTGELRPRKSGVVRDIETGTSAESRSIERGGLLGWFNMGSTVIVLMPPGSSKWRPDRVEGSTLRMGEAIGTLLTGSNE